jgi:hypothetical protein
MDDPAAIARRQALMDEEIRRAPKQIARVVDYLVVPTDEVGSDVVPAGHGGCPVDVGNGVRLERIDRALADRIFAASSLYGENWNPAGGPASIHAYVRDTWSEGEDFARLNKMYNWDSEERIWPVVHLSRLLRDNGTSTQYAVRLLVHRDDSEVLVPCGSFETHTAYRLYPERRGWLDEAEAVELRRLVEAYADGSHLPKRVQRALRRTASISRERYLEDALPLVIGGLESLIKVGRRSVTAQVTRRVPALAVEHAVDGLTVERCEVVYDDRSALVHGADVDLSVPQHLDDFGRSFVALQETLRRVVRHSIEDPEFAAVFAEDDAIQARWPVYVPTKGGGERLL